MNTYTLQCIDNLFNDGYLKRVIHMRKNIGNIILIKLYFFSNIIWIYYSNKT